MCSHDAIVVSIRDGASLLVARDYVLDGIMPLDSIKHDATLARCEVFVLLPEKTIARYERIGVLLWRRSTPFRRWKLVFHGVTSVQYRFQTGAMRTGDFSIGDIHFDLHHVVSIVTHEGLHIHLGVERLQGELIRSAGIDLEHTLSRMVVRLFAPPEQTNN